MTIQTFTRILLNEYPSDNINANTFREEVFTVDQLQPGPHQVLVKVLYISVDPIIRTWITPSVHGAMESMKVGEVVRASALGIVVQKGTDVSLVGENDIVVGLLGIAPSTCVFQLLKYHPGLTEYGVYHETELFRTRFVELLFSTQYSISII